MKGVLLPLVLLFVGFFGSIFFLPPCQILWLLPFCGGLARKAIDYVTALWLKLIPALLEVVLGVKVKICGDLKPLKGPCLIVLNHRTRFDWMFLWCYLIRMGNLNCHKIILKKSLRKVPFFGWAMQAGNFLFLSREWQTDKQNIADNLEYFMSINYPLQLLIFPEGTDLSPSNKEKSKKFTEERGLPNYDYVLYPKTKGFALCVEELRKSKVTPTLVNMSVGYVGGGMPQNERDIAAGNLPKEIHFFAEQKSFSDLPQGEEALGEWLQSCWREKESQLREFYTKKRFSSPYMLPSQLAESRGEMKSILVFWVLFFSWLAYSFYTSSFYWWYYPIGTVFYFVLNYFISGTDYLILRRYKLFNKQ